MPSPSGLTPTRASASCSARSCRAISFHCLVSVFSLGGRASWRLNPLMTTPSSLESLIEPRTRDLGGLTVRRVLPSVRRRQVGPFVFLDHMGPVEFAPGTGMDVRPHPHINLATVTYLWEGTIDHRDSLGSFQAIEPGAINWMTAGRGIVHSERTPAALRSASHRLHGIQLWVALPAEREEMAPAFHHHSAESLPRLERGGVSIRLLA